MILTGTPDGIGAARQAADFPQGRRRGRGRGGGHRRVLRNPVVEEEPPAA
ncbi:MAG: hypothetical protein WDO13_11030 [Verrucomicrobiota bacterium]